MTHASTFKDVEELNLKKYTTHASSSKNEGGTTYAANQIQEALSEFRVWVTHLDKSQGPAFKSVQNHE